MSDDGGGQQLYLREGEGKETQKKSKFLLLPQKEEQKKQTKQKKNKRKKLSTMFLPSIPTISLFPVLIFHLLTPSQTTAQNFPFESIQLTEAESLTNPFLHFGNNSQPTKNDNPRCKTTPTDADWPTDAEWSSLNTTLNGALLKPRPLALPCYNEGSSYDGARCETLRRGWGDMTLQ